MSLTLQSFLGTMPLVLFLAKATPVLIGALIATAWLRHSTAGSRHLVWLAALVGVLALPVLSRISSLHLGVLPSFFGVTESSAPGVPTTPATVEIGPGVISAEAARTIATVIRPAIAPRAIAVPADAPTAAVIAAAPTADAAPVTAIVTVPPAPSTPRAFNIII